MSNTKRRRTVITCIDCGEQRVHQARGLCDPCYRKHQYGGTLADFERLNHARQDLLDDWELLRSEGYTRAQAAARLGITKCALEKAIARERNAQATGYATVRPDQEVA